MATKSIKVNGKTINYETTSVTVNTVKFSDGVSLTLTGSVAAKAVLAAYNAYLAGKEDDAPVVTPPVVTPPVVTPPVTTPSKQIELGTGSGQVEIPSLTDTIVKIKKGSYGYISVGRGKNVVVDLQGSTLPNGSIYIQSSDGVEIINANFVDQSYRCITIEPTTNNLKITNCSFKNVKDYVISYNSNNKVYDKTAATASTGWTISGCTFDNTATCFNSGGGLNGNNVTGLLKGFKFINNTIKNSPTIAGAVWLGAAEDYEFAYNVIDNINTKQDNHNGIFHAIGNGSIHDNTCTNHQGNLIRAWNVSFDDKIKTTLIYNNKVYNSRKYSAFELQNTPDILSFIKANPTKLYGANAKVYGNTVGKMNTNKDWDGQVLDLYDITGTLEYYNNLGFELNKSSNNGNVALSSGDSMINNMSGVKITVNNNNKYFNTAKEAVADVASLKSLTDIGAK